jgi:hypothetical protein
MCWCIVIDAPTLPERVCDDPDDDKFLAAALASGARLAKLPDNPRSKLEDRLNNRRPRMRALALVLSVNTSRQ